MPRMTKCIILWLTISGLSLMSAGQDPCGPAHLSGSSGEFSSPYFRSNTSIEDRPNCEWDITVDPDKVIEIQIVDREPADACVHMQWDVLDNEIRIHYERSSRFRGRNNCSHFNTTVLSSSTNTVKVIFSSSNSLGSSGFSATYKAVNPEEAANLYRECGGVVTGLNGTITSPGYPNNYTETTKCTWHIIPDPTTDETYDFVLKFPEFHLNTENTMDYEHDYVELYNDGLVRIPRPERYYGEGSFPKTVTSSSKNITVVFLSDNFGTNKGFVLKFLTQKEEFKKADCDKTFRTLSNTITSPGYPGNYYNYLRCDWTILLSKKRDMILLNFTEFEVEKHGNCDYDKLYIKDQRYHGQSRLCGDAVPRPWYLSTRDASKIIVSFDTDGTITKRGFVLNYRQLNCEENLTADSSSFTSPNYPHPSPSSIECTWNIIVKPGNFVQLTIHDLQTDFAASGKCLKGFVEVFSGVNKTLVGRYCGSRFPDMITSTDNVLTIKFRSFIISILNTGFSMSYTSVKTAPVTATPECGGLLEESTGTITSPDYPNNYLPNLNCTWIIRPKSPFNYINITIISLDLEDEYKGFCYDVLKIDFRSYCSSSKLPRTVDQDSTAKERMVAFITDDVIQKKGFSLRYEAVVGTCGGNVTGVQGNISAPVIGFTPANINCTWTITVPNGLAIQLNTTEIRCDDGYFDVFTGSENSFIERYCTNDTIKVPAVLYLLNNIVTVTYHNIDDKTYENFKVFYTGIDINSIPVKEECFEKLTKNSGTIVSGYPLDTTCTWEIVVTPGKVIQMEFTEFDLEDDHDFRDLCANDYVEIQLPDQQPIRQCDNRLPPYLKKISTTDNKVTIVLFSDVAEVGRGFRLSYTGVPFRKAISDKFKKQGDAVTDITSSADWLTFRLKSVPSINPGYDLASKHFLKIAKTHKKIKLPKLFKMLLSNYKSLVQKRGIIRSIEDIEESISELRFTKMNTTVQAELHCLLVLKNQEKVNKGLLFPKKSKIKKFGKFYNVLRLAYFDAAELLGDMEDLWFLLPLFINTRYSREPIPYIHAARLLDAGAQLLEVLTDNLQFLGESKNKEEIKADFCNIQIHGPVCILEKLDEIEALQILLGDIVRERRHRDVNSDINALLKRITRFKNLKDEIRKLTK